MAPKSSMKELPERFAYWLIFSVLVALLPIVFNMGKAYFYGEPVILSSLLKNGELLIISVAIGADALGRIIEGGSNQNILKLPRIVATGSCLCLVILSSLFFSLISTDFGNSPVDPERTSTVSMTIFFLTIITGGSCLYLSEVDK
jgi:hypothetical protein